MRERLIEPVKSNTDKALTYRQMKGRYNKAMKEGSQLVPVGAVSDAEIFIVKIWKIFVDISLPFWGKVTGLIYGL